MTYAAETLLRPRKEVPGLEWGDVAGGFFFLSGCVPPPSNSCLVYVNQPKGLDTSDICEATSHTYRRQAYGRSVLCVQGVPKYVHLGSHSMLQI
jgi:hypothetical protein